MNSWWMTPALDWADFWCYAILLGLLYGLVYYSERQLRGGWYLQAADAPVRSFVRVALLILDPLLLLMFLALFVAVWPFVHGLIVLLVLVFAYQPLRDYIFGRILRFDQGALVGKHLISGTHRGVINSFGLTGLYLQQEEGRTRLAYAKLLSQGYTVAIDPSVSAYYHLMVGLPEPSDEALEPVTTPERPAGNKHDLITPPQDLDSMTRRLRNRLVESPYVRRGFTIMPHAGDEHGYLLDLDVGLHRGDHVRHLIRQLREAGFEASLINR